MKFIVGKKIEMTQIYKEDGTVIPVTAVLAMPNIITQIKSESSKDGYNAIQVGFGTAKKNGKSFLGHLKGLPPVKAVKEFRVKKEDTEILKRGDIITVAIFNEGDEVKVSGTSKGKGFQGVVKRHGFHGSPKTHGHKDQLRMPGSIGAGGVQRVFKGRRMAGRMGNEKVTIRGLKIVSIDEINNILYIKGAIPGARNSLVYICGDGLMELKQPLNSVENLVNNELVDKNNKEAINEITKSNEASNLEASTEEVKSE